VPLCPDRLGGAQARGNVGHNQAQIGDAVLGCLPGVAVACNVKGMTMSKMSKRAWLWGGAVGAALLLAGCAVEWQNKQPAEEMAQRAKLPGSVYVGWRVFQDRCASCHGAAATGTINAPDLLPRVRDMGSRRFVGLVLQRYDWTQSPAGPTGRTTAEREAQVEIIMQRKDAPLAMPAWQGEPSVNAHILDLYAYLAARAEGTQGPERPLQ
jgi:hypothetical protein